MYINQKTIVLILIRRKAMRKLSATLLCSFFFFTAAAQDVIRFSNNDTLQATVTEINSTTISYTLPQQSLPVFKVDRGNVKKITFASGNEMHLDAVLKVPNSDPHYQLGEFHAREHYRTKVPKMATFVSSAVFPPLGLAAAVTFANVPSQEENMLTPDYELFKNLNYRNGYVSQAKKIRQRKVWVGFGLGTLVSAAVYGTIKATAKD